MNTSPSLSLSSVLSSQLLAKKVFTLYSLAMQQLSKQDHYDFGLRALTSLLRYAGKKRRSCAGVPNEEVHFPVNTAPTELSIAKMISSAISVLRSC